MSTVTAAKLAEDFKLMERIERDQLRDAERAVERARRRLAKAEEMTQRAWDRRTEAEEALSAAQHRLHLVVLSQRK